MFVDPTRPAIVEVEAHDPGAVAGEEPHHRSAEVAAAAGDYGHLAGDALGRQREFGHEWTIGHMERVTGRAGRVVTCAVGCARSA